MNAVMEFYKGTPYERKTPFDVYFSFIAGFCKNSISSCSVDESTAIMQACNSVIAYKWTHPEEVPEGFTDSDVFRSKLQEEFKRIDTELSDKSLNGKRRAWIKKIQFGEAE